MTINGVIAELARSNREGAALEDVAAWCAQVDGWVVKELWAGDERRPGGDMAEGVPSSGGCAATFPQRGKAFGGSTEGGACEDTDPGLFARRLEYRYPEEGDRELLVEAPWDRVYFFYACAMIDLSKRQYADYNNELSMYNELFQDYARHWRREHRPRRSGNLRV